MANSIYELPSPNRFSAQLWPHLKRSTGEIIKHKFTRNTSKCTRKQIVTDNVAFLIFTIPSRHFIVRQESLSPLIQAGFLRKSNDVFASEIWKALHLSSSFTINRVLLWFGNSTMMARRKARRTHQTQRSFYITLQRQEGHVLLEKYASELHQVMIMHLSRAGLISWDQMESHGRFHFTMSQNIIFLCIKNLGKTVLFQTNWTQFYRLLQEWPNVNQFIH